MDSNIFQNGETNLLEFKERLPEKGEKYLKTIIAFANGKGGQLIFGIRDTDRAVVGIPREGIFRMMDSIAQNITNGCEPSIIPDISIKNIEDKSILIITIQPGKQKPYYLKSDEAVQFVLRHIRRGCTFEGIYRKDIYELPPDSIREIIVNAVLHRSYIQPSSIQVAVYDDRVEITSPGRWIPGMSEKNIREGYSRVRNHALAEAFDYMGVCEKWGSGLSRVFQEMQNRGLPEPEFIETELYLRVNLYRRITDTSQIEPAIIRELSLHPQLTQNQLAERIGVSVQAIKRVFAQMRKKGIISRTGNNRSGEWLNHPPTR